MNIDLSHWIALWLFLCGGLTVVISSIGIALRYGADRHAARAEELEQQRLLLVTQAQIPRPVGFRPTPRA